MTDYIDQIFDTFLELRGDRKSGDDRNIIGGLARLNGYKVVFIGYQRDKAVEPKAPGPEGYRKCSRLIHLAEVFNKPVIVFIDALRVSSLPTSEQQQTSEALARNLEEMFGLITPIICVIMGECGKITTVDMCAADRVLAMSYSVNAMRETILGELDQLTQINSEVLVQQRLCRLQYQFLSSGNSGGTLED